MALRNNAFEYFITLKRLIKARGMGWGWWGGDIHFLKLCGCCSSVPCREVPGLAVGTEALLWLMGCLCCRVQFPQRSKVWLPERLWSALAVASADWLSTQRLWRQR